MTEQIFATLVGVNFRGAEAIAFVRDSQTGHSWNLEAEPSNPYDANAVKVIDPDSGLFVGYLSRESNMETAAHLNSGGKAFATTVSFLGTIKPHLLIEFGERPVVEEVVDDETPVD